MSHKDSQFIWMDGKLVAYDDARVHVLSHTLHYGTGAFEGMRAYAMRNGKTAIFRSNDHWKRFIDSIHALGFEITWSISDMERGAIDCVRRNEFKECYVRPIAFLDDAFRGLNLPKNPKANIAIATWAWGKYMGDEGQQKGVRIRISTYRRADVSTSLPLAKVTGAYLTSVLARREATDNGFDEALLLDPEGFVAEGSGENIFIVKNGELITPPTHYILPGITRDSIIEVARNLGIHLREERITRNQLYLADEAFFTGTAVEVNAIREIDHKVIGKGAVGPVTKKLMETFFQIVRGELGEYKKWLTEV